MRLLLATVNAKEPKDRPTPQKQTGFLCLASSYVGPEDYNPRTAARGRGAGNELRKHGY